jgi:hypothetical protein
MCFKTCFSVIQTQEKPLSQAADPAVFSLNLRVIRTLYPRPLCNVYEDFEKEIASRISGCVMRESERKKAASEETAKLRCFLLFLLLDKLASCDTLSELCMQLECGK